METNKEMQELDTRDRERPAASQHDEVTNVVDQQIPLDCLDEHTIRRFMLPTSNSDGSIFVVVLWFHHVDDERFRHK